MITLAQIKSATEHMKRNALKPRRVRDQAEADAMNALDAKLYAAALDREPSHRWKVGDEYFEIGRFGLIGEGGHA